MAPTASPFGMAACGSNSLAASMSQSPNIGLGRSRKNRKSPQLANRQMQPHVHAFVLSICHGRLQVFYQAGLAAVKRFIDSVSSLKSMLALARLQHEKVIIIIDPFNS